MARKNAITILLLAALVPCAVLVVAWRIRAQRTAVADGEFRRAAESCAARLDPDIVQSILGERGQEAIPWPDLVQRACREVGDQRAFALRILRAQWHPYLRNQATGLSVVAASGPGAGEAPSPSEALDAVRRETTVAGRAWDAAGHLWLSAAAPIHDGTRRPAGAVEVCGRVDAVGRSTWTSPLGLAGVALAVLWVVLAVKLMPCVSPLTSSPTTFIHMRMATTPLDQIEVRVHGIPFLLSGKGQARIVRLSTKGAGLTLILGRQVERGARLKLSIRLPGEERARALSVKVTGVAPCTENPGSYRVVARYA